LTRSTIECLLKEARKRLHAQYKFYASLVGAELQDYQPEIEDDPKKLLGMIKNIGVDFEISGGK